MVDEDAAENNTACGLGQCSRAGVGMGEEGEWCRASEHEQICDCFSIDSPLCNPVGGGVREGAEHAILAVCQIMVI